MATADDILKKAAEHCALADRGTLEALYEYAFIFFGDVAEAAEEPEVSFDEVEEMIDEVGFLMDRTGRPLVQTVSDFLLARKLLED